MTRWFAFATSTALSASLFALAWGCGGDEFGGAATSGTGGVDSTSTATTGNATHGATTGADATSTSTSTSSTSGAGGAGGGGTCMALGDACTACELQACPKIYCACFGDAECGALSICESKCDAANTMCFQACLTAHSEAISKGSLLVNCAGVSCPNDCPGYKPLDKCDVCLYTKCSEAMNTCLGNPACTALFTCVLNCKGVAACESTCAMTYPDGIVAAGPVDDCVKGTCGSDCPTVSPAN